MKKIIFAALLFVIAMGVRSLAAVPETVRIGINPSSPSKSVALSSDGGIYTYSAFAKGENEAGPYFIANSITAAVSASGTVAVNGVDSGETKIDFFKGSELVSCAGKLYRGDIRLKVSNGGLVIINILKLDDYLYGVVGREMSEGFPIEALKAQAVAARNYTVISMGRHSSGGFDLCAGVHCQAYGGYASEGEKVRQAVNETSGRLLLYKGAPVQCYYYSSNGGYSENSENVWVAELGYLKGKRDPYEDGSRISGYNWTVMFTASEIKETLAKRDIDIGDITDVKVVKYSKNHHALELEITGTAGKKSYYKDNIRAAMPKSLNSTLFTVAKSGGGSEVKVLTANGLITRAAPDSLVLTGGGREKIGGAASELSFTFSGSGWGHGVGMSQYGAMFMAEQGHTYEDILKFYYTDTEIG